MPGDRICYSKSKIWFDWSAFVLEFFTNIHEFAIGNEPNLTIAFTFGPFYFRIHDACKILILPLGNALLLTETLKSDIKTKQNSKQALAEIGVVNMSNLMALDILERRNDICSY